MDNHNRGICIYTLCKDNINRNNIEYRTYEPDPGAPEAYALLIEGRDVPSTTYDLMIHISDKFKIKNEKQILIVILNKSDKEVKISIPFKESGVYKEQFGEEKYDIVEENFEISISSMNSKILKKD